MHIHLNYQTMKKALHCKLDAEVVDEVKSAVKAVVKLQPSYTLRRCIQDALEREVRRLRKRFNDGEKFRTTRGPLRMGAPRSPHE